ncbi:MAG: hypothetical protein WC907_02265 [Acholeplasmataceae bacterium]
MKKRLILFLIIFILTSCHKPSNNKLYSLKDAYDSEIITKNDLKDIAYYLNDDSMPIYPDELDVLTEKEIKISRLNLLKSLKDQKGKLINQDATINDITIHKYFGVYNDAYAVIIHDNYTGYGQAVTTITVGGIDLTHPDGNLIVIWYNK